MQEPLWTVEDGVQLRALMVSRGLDDWQLASANALTVRQVRELIFGEPEGQASCFYSPQIKRYAGQRLLAKLA